MPYRLLYIGLGLLAVAAIAFGIAFNRSGDELVLPEEIEAISPNPGDLVPPQTSVEVDLPVAYRADIYVDDWLVTDVVFVEGTGVYRWAPSPQTRPSPDARRAHRACGLGHHQPASPTREKTNGPSGSAERHDGVAAEAVTAGRRRLAPAIGDQRQRVGDDEDPGRPGQSHPNSGPGVPSMRSERIVSTIGVSG